MRITVNGTEREAAAGATLAELLRDLGLPDRGVAVERNRALVKKADYGGTVLSEGDRLEIVTFVGGG
jgi:thiamine biosynthesis protein ThiS